MIYPHLWITCLFNNETIGLINKFGMSKSAHPVLKYANNKHFDGELMATDIESVATRLHQFLTEIGISQAHRGKDVQEKLGFTQSQYAKTLTGAQFPTVHMMQELRLRHQMNITWLLTGLGPMFSLESDGGIDLKVQVAVKKLCTELKVNLPPRKLEHVCRVISRSFDRTKKIDLELIKDLVS